MISFNFKIKNNLLQIKLEFIVAEKSHYIIAVIELHYLGHIL